MSPECLVLEITEAGPSDITQDQIDAVSRLRMRGFTLSIDDFGTGVSSLERLIRIPFDELKIDWFFTRDMKRHNNAKSLIRNVVRIAKSMGMTVTIEGIEDSETMQLALKFGCDIGQGYYFAKPMSASIAHSWLMGWQV